MSFCLFFFVPMITFSVLLILLSFFCNFYWMCWLLYLLLLILLIILFISFYCLCIFTDPLLMFVNFVHFFSSSVGFRWLPSIFSRRPLISVNFSYISTHLLLNCAHGVRYRTESVLCSWLQFRRGSDPGLLDFSVCFPVRWRCVFFLSLTSGSDLISRRCQTSWILHGFLSIFVSETELHRSETSPGSRPPPAATLHRLPTIPSALSPCAAVFINGYVRFGNKQH